MERFCVVVFETIEERKKTIHDILAAYAVKWDTEVVIQWLKPWAKDEEILRVCTQAQLAFVSTAPAEHGIRMGKLLYQANPWCALVYYGHELSGSAREAADYFTSLFPARPVMYLNQPGPADYYRAVEAAAETELRKGRFTWETKGLRYRVRTKRSCIFEASVTVWYCI